MKPRASSCSIVLCVFAAISAGVAAAQQAQEVSFQTWDKVTIVADYVAPKKSGQDAPMAILLHMYRSDKKAWKPLLAPLHEAGFAVLAIDLRGHGISVTDTLRSRIELRDPKVFEEMFQDVRAAYDFLASQEGVDRSRFGLVGASVGCSVALRYAAKDRSVDAVVCMSPGLKYLGLDSEADMPKIRGRQLWFVATDNDRAAPEKLATMTRGVDVRIFDGKAHGTKMFGQVSLIEKGVADFLRHNVGDASDEIVYGSINSDIYHLKGSGWIDRIKPTNMRHYSTADEARKRGLRESKSRAPRD